jgi:Sensory domain found in PocR
MPTQIRPAPLRVPPHLFRWPLRFALPIRIGDQLIGFLQTGQVLLNQPTKFRFDQTAKRLVDWGVNVDLRKAREAYFHTKVLTRKQYRAILRLLEIFDRHLSILSNQIALENSDAEPAAVTRAKEFIARKPGQRALSCHSRQGGQHQHILFLQTLQACHRTNLHRLRGSCAR